ncbi:MAG TPA: formate--tetrahydrofolate ligase [Planctomycetota bacterium]|nr:formate--tetrahydrofolate ligase [Planctomycetota bacterium]
MTLKAPKPQVTPLTDIEIARAATPKPILEISRALGIPDADVIPYGHTKGKISLGFCERARGPVGKLVLVTAISPTPAGEGKTTTTVGLGDALNRIGKKATICLREPSLGPVFGMKGGAAGGGRAQVIPMEDINLHFTGDFHAITSAHNLLAALVDNHLHQGNVLGIDPRRISWRRVLDVNDRALRDIVIGLGGTGNSIPRESGFDITAASEVMAVLTLSSSLEDLRQRLGRMVIGETYARKRVSASDLKAEGALLALLRDALMPNLVQTLENNPALVHCGPFANIAHGCNSVMATALALRLGEYTVTEAGFGADLGAEKFFDIKCRAAGLKPDATVIVATIRALKHQAGVEQKLLSTPDPAAVRRGLEHLEQHLENLARFGVPTVVAINSFTSDTQEEIDVLLSAQDRLGVRIVSCDHWARGGAGAEELARAVVVEVESNSGNFRHLYADELGLLEKIEKIAREIYGADGVTLDEKFREKLRKFEKDGFGNLPICMAKTQYSFSTDPSLHGRPRGFQVPLRDCDLRAGAGFILVLTGDVMTMPGLPKLPAAESIDVDGQGRIQGLF